MNNVLELTESQSAALTPGDTIHWFCSDCYPDADEVCLAYCGLDISKLPTRESEPSLRCVMCVMVDEESMPWCPEGLHRMEE